MKRSTRSVERSLIAVSYAYDLLHVMEDRGASSEAIVRDSGIPAALLKGHDARLTAGQFANLVRACGRHGDVAGLGYAFGLNVKPPSHGLLGLAMLNCRTPREAMVLGERFSPLRVGLARLRVVEDGDTTALQVEVDEPLPDLQVFFHECLIAIMVRVAHALVGTPPRSELWFEHAEPAYHRTWQPCLPPSRFGMPATQLRVPTSLLDQPLPHANPLSARAAVHQMETQLDRVATPSSLVSQVQRLLAAARDPLPSLSEVAALLNISPSTLKRRLQQEGTSFQQQIDDVRRTRAMDLLREPGRTIEQVGRKLGYSDAANFTRAFRKWTGQSPTSWRNGR